MSRLARDIEAAGGRLALFVQLLRAAEAHAAACPTCSAARRDAVDESAVMTDGVHLTARDLGKLHAFAAGLGFKRSWFQEPGRNIASRRTPHYDLTTTAAFHRACAGGAAFIPPRTFAQLTAAWTRPAPEHQA
jgi:hypothetical protein